MMKCKSINNFKIFLFLNCYFIFVFDFKNRKYMKKIIFSFITIFTFTVCTINAQETKETVEPFQKGRQPAFSITLDYSKTIVEAALAERLEKDKLKGKSLSGFMEYTDVDYTKVVGNGKSATIYIFISKDHQNFVSSGDDQETANNVQLFLKTIVIDVRNYVLKLDIEEQGGIVKKAEADYSKLVDEQEKLLIRQKELEKELKDAKSNMNIQKGILEKLEEKGFEKY